MTFIPNQKIGIKDDKFRHMRWCLRLWAQRKKFYPMCIAIFVIKMIGFGMRTMFILKSTNDAGMLLEVSATYSISLLAVMKLGFLLKRREHVSVLFSAVTQKFWHFSVGGERLENYLNMRFKFINMLLLGHLLSSSGYVVAHLVFPYIPIPEGRTRWLPTLISCPCDQDQSPTHEILYVMLSWNMFISVFGNGFFDCVFIYGAQHLTAQFMILKKVLRNIENGLMEKADDVDKFKSVQFQREIQMRVSVCVEHHTLLLSYGKELKNITSSVFGVQLFTTWITLVLLGYKLTENFDEISQSTMLLSFVFSATMQFSIFAIQSEDIFDQSSSVAKAAYQSNWYLFKASARRGLSLLIMNSQGGISMYAAELAKINNAIIVNMGQKVFSAITLLRSLEEMAEQQ